ncbi:hypothetical protein J0X14_08160 [Muricauda sp. CAU 1633]|uniref:hypothetical protein n=1 Tax=Allomuricauda sp. CAU 1633 TaxID=2816036 RepID=UPI001A8D6FDE|nr:hypothetical protein [Muricauda sp. CAU 1633]MBO0322265.1 hypothetical protein [Muricauda sp. CAU 1633]
MINKVTLEHLNQLRGILVQLTDEQFAEKLSIMEGASIGSHTRHVLEFYNCLFNAIEQGELCYDRRQRDKEMEVSVNKCISSIDGISEILQSGPKDFQLLLTADFSLDEESGQKIATQTTYHRELLYNIEHMVHHLAIIRIGVKSMPFPVHFDDTVGVAASTIRNKKICVR